MMICDVSVPAERFGRANELNVTACDCHGAGGGISFVGTRLR
jgi:hypothetical protein